MAANGVKTSEDAEMAECDGEKVVTMMDVLQEQEDFEEDANAVLGASDDKNCTYSKGYVKRQAIYACLTCCPEASKDPSQRAGVCLACSLACHENHDLVELYTKRNFRCDCGNPKFSQPCQFTPDKYELNYDNKYNQNFSGLYCVCQRPYPDPEATEEEEMLQCIICEDWLHTKHLEATVPLNEQYSEMVCKACMEDNDFLHDYSHLVVNIVDKEIIVTDPDLDVSAIIKKKAEEAAKKLNVTNGDTEIPNEKDTKVSDEPKSINSNEGEKETTSTDIEMSETKPTEEAEKKDENGQETTKKEVSNDVPSEQTETKEADDKTEETKQDSGNTDPVANDEQEQKEIDSETKALENGNKDELEKLDESTNNAEKLEIPTTDTDTAEAAKPETNTEANTEEKKGLENSDPNTEEKKDSENSDTNTEEKKDSENSDTNTEEKKDSENSDTNKATSSKEDDIKDAVNETSDKENESPATGKRKHSTEADVSPKKVKLELKPCTRPRGVKRVYKGATFWPSTLRQALCTCNECLDMYKDLAVLFLTDVDDTVTAYEALGKRNNGGTSFSQYEKGLQALSSLDRIQQINALTEYNKMRDKLLDFLKSFKDRKEIVKEEDIKAFFAGMKPKREPDGVYFCR